MNSRDAWNITLNQLELQLDQATFDTWLRKTTFLAFENQVFKIGVPSDYVRDMLQHRLYHDICNTLTTVFGFFTEIEFVVQRIQPHTSFMSDDDSEEMPLFKLLAQQMREQEKREEQDTQSLSESIRSPQLPSLPESRLNPRFTFQRFITSFSNQVVYEAAQAIVDYPASIYNPFLIYGGVGLGKTHTLQAIAHACQSKGLQVMYVPSEAFTNDLIQSIRNRTTAMFRERYRSIDVLLVDDIQFIGGKETTQEEFFHTFNALVNFNKQVVLASDRHPRELSTLEDRLRSRFQGGLVADIQAPSFETRVAILEMWANERNLEIPYDVIYKIAESASKNIRELEGVFNQIIVQMRLNDGKPLSIYRTESTIERYHRPRRKISTRIVVEVTANCLQLDAEDLTGKKRASRINRARQIAMFLARELTDESLPQIGAEFGRSHTTVLHGYNKIAEDAEFDSVLAAQIAKIRKNILKEV